MQRSLALLVVAAAAAFLPATAANADDACVRLVGHPIQCYPHTPLSPHEEICTSFGNPSFLCV